MKFNVILSINKRNVPLITSWNNNPYQHLLLQATQNPNNAVFMSSEYQRLLDRKHFNKSYDVLIDNFCIPYQKKCFDNPSLNYTQHNSLFHALCDSLQNNIHTAWIIGNESLYKDCFYSFRCFINKIFIVINDTHSPDLPPSCIFQHIDNKHFDVVHSSYLHPTKHIVMVYQNSKFT